MKKTIIMNLKTKPILIHLFVLTILVAPVFVHGQQNPKPPPNTNLIVCGSAGQSQCTFADLIVLAKNFINFLIYIAVPLAALSFAWAGFKIMTAAGEEAKVKEGKVIFEKVALGLIFVLAAWLIIHTILIALLNPGYSLLS